MTPHPERSSERWQRWCGVCFYWQEEREGACVECGTRTMMSGERLPLTPTLGMNVDIREPKERCS